MAYKLVWVSLIVSLVIVMINNSSSEEIPRRAELIKNDAEKEDTQQKMSGSEINAYHPYYKTNEKVILFVLLFSSINVLEFFCLFLRILEEMT